MGLKPHVMEHLVSAFENRRDKRLTEHKRVRQASEREAATLNALEQFRSDRLSQRRTRNGHSEQAVSVPQQAHESRFDGRLVDAIKQQTETLEKMNVAATQSANELEAAQRKLAAMQVLLNRQTERARQKSLRAEQKFNDELASKRHENSL